MVVDATFSQYRGGGATTPKLKNALSKSSSLYFSFDVHQPFAGGSGPFDLGPAPLRRALVPRHGQKGFIDHPGGGSSLRLVDTSGAPWVLPFPAPCRFCSFDSFFDSSNR